MEMKKVKKKSLAKLKKTADDLWGLIIRTRDPVCRLCKARPTRNAHHIMNRRHKNTRHDLRNGMGLCYRCHLPEGHGDPCHMAELIRGEIGDDLYMDLLLDCQKVIKYDINWLKLVIERLK
jgi:hypothetical protein